MEKFDLCERLEDLNIRSLINNEASYEAIVKALSQIPLEGDKEKYIQLLKEKRGIPKEAIRRDIQLFLKNRHSKKGIRKEDNAELSEDEKKEALVKLEDDDFWESFLNTTELLGYVGESENKITLYLILTSRKLDDPINAIVKGESSAGKSFNVSGVTQFFPREEVLELTALTPKALYHRKDSLKNKALIIYERSGAEESDYSLRTLQSEKKLIFSTTVKDPNTGNFETKDIEIEGPIAYIETTTKPHIHPENETRCFDLYIDESEEQTKRIHEAQNRRHKIMTLDKEAILNPWRNAQRLLKIYPVYIPYINIIKFPTKPLRVRRDRLRFLALIEASALLFQYKREKQVINGKEFVVANIEDYALAYNLIGKILESVLKGLSPKVKELIEIAKAFDGQEFTRKNLQQKIAWNEKTIDKYVEEAVTWGYFEIAKEGGKGKAYHYLLVKTDDNPIGLLTPEELVNIIPSIPIKPQKDDGDFKPASDLDKEANPQYPQRKMEGGEIYT